MYLNIYIYIYIYIHTYREHIKGVSVKCSNESLKNLDLAINTIPGSL